MKITEALLAEHLVFHHLLDHIEKVAPQVETLPEIKSMAHMLAAMLKAHSRTEDDLLIGPLEHCFEQIGQRELFHQEHEEIDEDLMLVQETKRLGKARELLLVAVSASRKHFDKEERIVFPMAEEVLKTDTLEELGQAWMDQRKEPAH